MENKFRPTQEKKVEHVYIHVLGKYNYTLLINKTYKNSYGRGLNYGALLTDYSVIPLFTGAAFLVGKYISDGVALMNLSMIASEVGGDSAVSGYCRLSPQLFVFVCKPPGLRGYRTDLGNNYV